MHLVLRMLSIVVCFSLTVSMIHADETEVDVVAIQKTVNRLVGGGHIPFLFTDEPMSEILDFCSVAREIEFRVESSDILTERVSVNIARKPFVESLQQTLSMHGCEMAILTDGHVLIRRTPEVVLATRQFLKAMQRQPKTTPWKERANLMTEQGFMELAGNLVWLALDEMQMTNKEELKRELQNVFRNYKIPEAAPPSDFPPYFRCTTDEEREAAQEAGKARNKMMIGVLARSGGKIYTLLDELESQLARHGFPLPEFHPKFGGHTSDADSAVVLVQLKALYSRKRGFLDRFSGHLELEFRRIGDGWKYHQTRWSR